MSMNLCFDTKIGNHHVEFPYQTSTKLTHAVLKEKDLEKQIQLVEDDIKTMYDPKTIDHDDLEYYNNMFLECKEYMRDKTLEISII